MYNIISFKVNVIKIGAKDQRYETLPSPPFIESPNMRAVTNPKKFRIRIRIQMSFFAEFRIRIL